MKEPFISGLNVPEKPKPKPNQDLGTNRSELMDAKKNYLNSLKDSIREVFGTEELPKDFILEAIEIRKDIKNQIARNEYADKIDEAAEQKIKRLASRAINHKKRKGDAAENIHENEEIAGDKEVEQDEAMLYGELYAYFDSYRLAHNAGKFRLNVRGAEDHIVQENAGRKLNFYSKGEKEERILEKLFEKYEQAGFEREEIRELIKTCNIEKLNNLEIHDIKILSKTKDIFSRFMSGDKTKYIGLSAALMVPAFLEGYAPIFFANAFKGGDKLEMMTQIGLYAMISIVSNRGSALIEKKFKQFLDQNFQKEDGYAGYIAENISGFPGDEIGKFGMEKIKNRIANAKYGYESMLRTLSFNVLPAMTTLITSAVMLFDKSPILAAGTVAGTGITMAIDAYVQKKGKFWEKEGQAESKAEKMAQKIEELLNAHMEVILSGEKDKLADEVEDLLSKERVAMSDRKYLDVIRNKAGEFSKVINYVLAGMAACIAGGSADQFVAAIIYSNNFIEGVSNILNAKRNLLESFRVIMQMELMFNGYAEEEKEKEKDRIGVSELGNSDINMKNVSIEIEKKKILDDINLEMKGGSFISLEGLSGAGKTTLMKVLSGYYKPTGGAMEFGGVDMDKIKKSGSDSIYSKIAYFSQYPYVMEDTVRNNLRFGISGEVADDEIREILSEVGLDARFPNLDEKLKGGKGDSGTTSGGETSRIGLARVILKLRKNNSKIVFLDEPTASVDKETVPKIAEIINNEKLKNPETTFISISHDKDFNNMLKDKRVISLKNGKVQKPEQLFGNK